MITEIKVSREDFEAEICVKTVYDDNEIMMDDKWIATARKGELRIIHKEGYLRFNQNGTLSDYYKICVLEITRVFKAIYPNWKEY
jgi:hypothetical protein